MNEEKLTPFILTEDYVLAGLYHGSVQVESGTCTILGTHQGLLTILAGATVRIDGLHQGNIHVAAGAKVVATGVIQGIAKIDPGGTLIIEQTGMLEGLLSNDGEVIVRGVISGGQIGNGHLRLEGRETQIKKPILHHGTTRYQ